MSTYLNFMAAIGGGWAIGRVISILLSALADRRRRRRGELTTWEEIQELEKNILRAQREYLGSLQLSKQAADSSILRPRERGQA